MDSMGDPRLIRLGSFLRSSGLDELPQLLNVLKGDMSLVGPRPTSFAPETYRLWHTERLEVVPGITGLWQISGRSTVGTLDMLKLDLAYVHSRRLALDLRILLSTIPVLLRGDGAR